MIKISFAVLAALSLTTAACSKKGDSGSGGDADCTASINTGVDRMAAARVPAKDLPPEIKAKMDDFNGKMKGVFIKHCTADKWPAPVVKCFEGITGRPDVLKCQQQLPADQQTALKTDIRELMVTSGIGRHGGGPNPHGGSDGATMGGTPGSAVAPITAAGSAAPMPATAAGSAH